MGRPFSVILALNYPSFSSDGKYIVFSSDDVHIRIWDANRGGRAFPPFAKDELGPGAVHTSPKCLHLSCDHEGTLQIYYLQKDPSLSTYIYLGQSAAPAGTRALSAQIANLASTILIFTAQEKIVGKPVIGHRDIIECLAVSPDEKYVVSGSWDQTVRLWDVEKGVEVAKSVMRDDGWVKTVGFSPADGRYIASGLMDRTIRVWNVDELIATNPHDTSSNREESALGSPEVCAQTEWSVVALLPDEIFCQV